jgi:putative spermidine/putrescine transport system substrate-binding protein
MNRRHVLQLGLGAGASALLPAALSGCRRSQGPLLLAAKGSMPVAWLDQLPSPWRQELVGGSGAVVQGLVAGQGRAAAAPALVSLPDGWAADLALNRLQPFGAAGVVDRLLPAAWPLSRLYRPEGQPVLAFPWAFSPWVMVFRSLPRLAARARGEEGWQVLEDPLLKGRVVLPSSPRVAIEICGSDLTRLQRLRDQALAYNDADALSLLLNGDALAAVVPLQRLISLLRRDSRLEVVWPGSGAPLTWQLLLRPAGMQPEPPHQWLMALLELPLLARILAGGWVPPLPRSTLAQALALQPRQMRELLLPADEVLQRCWSLPPLSSKRRLALQTLWDAADPSL